MGSASAMKLKVADQVWVATALLHRENPDRMDFSKQEIRERAEEEYLEGAKRPGISQHISTHCVASKPPTPAKHRMLSRTRSGRRRLFREGIDAEHPDRKEGNTCPNREDLPDEYCSLLDWYENEYNRKELPKVARRTRGATAEVMMKMMGRISQEDANELIQIINECCGQIDASEW